VVTDSPPPASLLLSSVAPFLQIFGVATTAAGKLTALIDREPAIDGTSEAGKPLPCPLRGDLALHNVCFAYPTRPGNQVLCGVSLDIPANKHTAIVGASGSGKSTIIALLARLYDPCSGSVALDGVDVSHLNVRQLRGAMSLVQQEPTLFDRSILENVALGLVGDSRPEHAHLKDALLGPDLADLARTLLEGTPVDVALAQSTPEAGEIYALARDAIAQAALGRFVAALPHGLATRVGSAGSRLSGGQKQRIALARALVRRPQMLLLDEATAALDSRGEALVQRALEHAAAGRTTVSVVHRLAAARSADCIVVMERGCVVERGSHGDLMALGGRYAGMVRMQSLARRDLGGPAAAENDVHVLPDDKAETSSGDEAEGLLPPPPPPDATFSKPMLPLGKTLAGMARLARPHMLLVVLGLAAATILGGVYPADAVVFGHTIGALNPCRGAEVVRAAGRLFALLFFVIALVEVAGHAAGGTLLGRAAEHVLYRARTLALRALLRRDLAWHESAGRTPSSLLSYVAADASALSGLSGTVAGTVATIVVSTIAGVAIAHAVAWRIAAVLLVAVPVLLGAGCMRLRVLARFRVRHQQAFAESVGVTVEAAAAIHTIAPYSLEHEALRVYRRALAGPDRAMLSAAAGANFWLAACIGAGNLVYALAYWWGARQVAAGLYTQTQFFVAMPALLFTAQLGGQMAALSPDLVKARVSAGNLLHLVGEEGWASEEETPLMSSSSARKKVDDVEMGGAEGGVEKANGGALVVTILPSSCCTPSGPSSPSSTGLAVSFSNVCFAYPSRPHAHVLRGLSLAIPPARSARSWGPRGRASRRSSTSCSASTSPRRAPSRSTAAPRPAPAPLRRHTRCAPTLPSSRKRASSFPARCASTSSSARARAPPPRRPTSRPRAAWQISTTPSRRCRWATTRRAGPAGAPLAAASGNASRSRAPWSGARGCCCSTSRRRRWTPRPSTCCSSRWSASSRAGAPSWRLRTASSRCGGRTSSSTSTAGGSRTRGRTRSCWRGVRGMRIV
jgi:ABC-type multidrug transport system fused ATPase/permease subunit